MVWFRWITASLETNVFGVPVSALINLGDVVLSAHDAPHGVPTLFIMSIFGDYEI